MTRYFLFLFLLCMPVLAQAQNFAPLTYGNVAKTLLRFGALNVTNDATLDDYAKLVECDLYFKNFRNDFAMQEQRTRLRQTLPAQLADFPDAYYFSSEMQLDKYDFALKLFRLAPRSRLTNINSFSLVKAPTDSVCVKGEKLKVFPEEVGATLDQPVTLDGLPIAEEQAKALIERMNKAKNFNRVIYARFSLSLVFAPPLNISNGPIARYNADAQLLNIEFFEDRAMTKLIWVFTRA